jgi:hypothetical protein
MRKEDLSEYRLRFTKEQLDWILTILDGVADTGQLNKETTQIVEETLHSIARQMNEQEGIT